LRHNVNSRKIVRGKIKLRVSSARIGRRGKGMGKRSTRDERLKKAFSHSAHLLHARQVLNCKGSSSECVGVNISIFLIAICNEQMESRIKIVDYT